MTICKDLYCQKFQCKCGSQSTLGNVETALVSKGGNNTKTSNHIPCFDKNIQKLGVSLKIFGSRLFTVVEDL